MKEYVLPEIAQKFVNDFKSEDTKKNYTVELSSFFEYVIKNRRWIIPIADITDTQIKRITTDDINDYIHIKNKNGSLAKDNTMKRRQNVISSFYKYLEIKKIINDNPTLTIKSIEVGEREPKFLSLEDCQKLLQSIDGKYKVRDFAMVTILLNTGLRLSELVGININKIYGNRLRVIGKGNKEREVRLNTACLNAINDLLAIRPKVKTNALFLSEEGASKGQRITTSRVEDIIKRYLTNIGHGDKSVHSLRHSAACLMLKGKANIKQIQETLGHKNMSTTNIYLHLMDDDLQSAVDNNPLNYVFIVNP